MLHLSFPTISHKSRYLDMIEEWKNHETPTSPGALFRGESFEEFLDISKLYVTANPNGINSTLFFFMEDEHILGAIQIRHHIDHPNLSLEGGCGGHIGYGLRPSARGKGLAREMLRLGLIEAEKLGIDKVLISAHEDNPASWKTIERCGGAFMKSIEKDGKTLKVYGIKNKRVNNFSREISLAGDNSESLIANKKPSRNEKKAKIKSEKAKIKREKKEGFRKKAEKKLSEKAERKIAHKKANAQRKFEAKLLKKQTSISK